MKYIRRRSPRYWPVWLLAILAILALTGCGVPLPESAVLLPAMEWDVVSSEGHPYANHQSPQVRAASRELQRVRDRCSRVDTGDPQRACAAPDDAAERAALARLEAAVAEARGRR